MNKNKRRQHTTEASKLLLSLITRPKVNNINEAVATFRAKSPQSISPVKVDYRPNYSLKPLNCIHNSIFENKDCQIVTGYVVYNDSVSAIDHGYRGWSVMPHYWNYDEKTDTHFDSTPVMDMQIKHFGSPSTWQYLCDSTLRLAVSEAYEKGLDVQALLTNLFIRDNGSVYIIIPAKHDRLNGELMDVKMHPLDDLDYGTLVSAWNYIKYKGYNQYAENNNT